MFKRSDIFSLVDLLNRLMRISLYDWSATLIFIIYSHKCLLAMRLIQAMDQALGMEGGALELSWRHHKVELLAALVVFPPAHELYSISFLR